MTDARQLCADSLMCWPRLTADEAANLVAFVESIESTAAKIAEPLEAEITDLKAKLEAAQAAKEEATRERIRAEEQAKAEQAAREKLAAEQAEAAKAERDRVAAEAAKVERIVTAPDVAPLTPPGPAAAAITHAQVVQHMWV